MHFFYDVLVLQIFFETFNVPALYISMQAVLSLYVGALMCMIIRWWFLSQKIISVEGHTGQTNDAPCNWTFLQGTNHCIHVLHADMLLM